MFTTRLLATGGHVVDATFGFKTSRLETRREFVAILERFGDEEGEPVGSAVVVLI